MHLFLPYFGPQNYFKYFSSYFGWDCFCGCGLWGSLLYFVTFLFLFIFLLKIDAVVDLSCHKPIAHESSSSSSMSKFLFFVYKKERKK